MIAVDTNILVYAHRRDSPLHSAAAEQVALLSARPGSWAIPWPCVHEFLAVVTRRNVYSPPSTIDEGLAQIREWFSSASLQLLHENSAHLPTLASLLTQSGVTGPKVHDARIAALCVSHGVDTILTMDRDFSAFPELKVRTLAAR